VARAALRDSVLLLVQDGVEGLQERGLQNGASGTSAASRVGGSNGQLGGDGVAAAAARVEHSVVSVAHRLLALEFALGAGAVGGLQALLAAVQLLAHRRALRLGSHASGVATGRLADGLALVASELLASVLGAADGAHRSLAVNSALSAGNLLAFHLALGASAHRVADGRALGVIAHPLADWMARAGSWQNHGTGVLCSEHLCGRNHTQQQKGSNHGLHFLSWAS